MKKILTIILALALVLSAFTVAFADEEISTTEKITLNEYALLKQLAGQNAAALSKAGYSSAEITAIQNYQDTYRNHVGELQALSDSALEAHGYTESQIDTIRNFTGTDAEMMDVGASLDLYSTTAMFSYVEGGRTTGRLAYNWSWTGVPAIKLRDMVAATWNDWAVTAQTSTVTYYSMTTGARYNQETAEFRYPEGDTEVAGAGHRFYAVKDDNQYYAKNGSGTFDLASDSFAKTNFYYYIEFGHATLSANIGFSVSAPGGAAGSVDWTVVTVTEDWERGNYEWPE